MPVIYLFNSIFLACNFSYCAFLCFACTVIFVPLLICFYTFVCRNKSSTELMLCMFKHVRQKIKFLNLKKKQKQKHMLILILNYFTHSAQSMEKEGEFLLCVLKDLMTSPIISKSKTFSGQIKIICHLCSAKSNLKRHWSCRLVNWTIY